MTARKPRAQPSWDVTLEFTNRTVESFRTFKHPEVTDGVLEVMHDDVAVRTWRHIPVLHLLAWTVRIHEEPAA